MIIIIVCIAWRSLAISLKYLCVKTLQFIGWSRFGLYIHSNPTQWILIIADQSLLLLCDQCHSMPKSNWRWFTTMCSEWSTNSTFLSNTQKIKHKSNSHQGNSPIDWINKPQNFLFFSRKLDKMKCDSLNFIICRTFSPFPLPA